MIYFMPFCVSVYSWGCATVAAATEEENQLVIEINNDKASAKGKKPCQNRQTLWDLILQYIQNKTRENT